MLIASASAAWL